MHSSALRPTRCASSRVAAPLRRAACAPATAVGLQRGAQRSSRGVLRACASPAPATEDRAWRAKVLYDGACMVCLTNKRLLGLLDRGRGRVAFADVAAAGYLPEDNGGVQAQAALDTFHTLVSDGEGEVTIARGAEAVLSAYAAVGSAWLVALFRLPPLRWVVAGVYAVISRHRHAISRWLPGGRALAAAAAAANNLSVASDDSGEGMAQCDTDCELPWVKAAEEKAKREAAEGGGAGPSAAAPAAA